MKPRPAADLSCGVSSRWLGLGLGLKTAFVAAANSGV